MFVQTKKKKNAKSILTHGVMVLEFKVFDKYLQPPICDAIWENPPRGENLTF